MLQEYKGTKQMADKLGENACAPIQTCYHPEREAEEYLLDLPNDKKTKLKAVEDAKAVAEKELEAARRAVRKAESKLEQAKSEQEELYRNLVGMTLCYTPPHHIPQPPLHDAKTPSPTTR